MVHRIDEENVLLYAARFYDNPSSFDTTEFYEDLKRVSYIKRLFNKYQKTGNPDDIKHRLIINHLTILFNVFGEFTVYILFLRLREYLGILIPFLVLIKKCPKKVSGIGPESEVIHTSDINMDETVISILRRLYEQQS